MVHAVCLVIALLAACLCQAKPDYRLELIEVKLETKKGHFTQDSHLKVINNADSESLLSGKLVFDKPLPEDLALQFDGHSNRSAGRYFTENFGEDKGLFCDYVSTNQDALKTMFSEADFSACPPKKGTVWQLGNSTINMALLPDTAPEEEWIGFIGGYIGIEYPLQIRFNARTIKINT